MYLSVSIFISTYSFVLEICWEVWRLVKQLDEYFDYFGKGEVVCGPKLFSHPLISKHVAHIDRGIGPAL